MNITEIFLFLIGIICGFLLFTLTTNYVKHYKEYSITFRIPFTENKIFHAHHWLISLIILILLICFVDIVFVNTYFFYFGLGILFGSIFHGLSYNDRFKIIY